MRIAILGSGMPGLVAAHAVDEFCRNHDLPKPMTTLFGPSERQRSYGARFYERQIPNLTVPQGICVTQSHGKADDYAKKLGSILTPYTRPRPSFLVFDYHQAYANLWDTYVDKIADLPITSEWINETEWAPFDYVISTVPRFNWYEPAAIEYFVATRHWRLDEIPGQAKLPYQMPKNNAEPYRMIFDGSDDSSWFRITQLFGLMTVEWPFDKRPPIDGVYQEILPVGVHKDLRTPNVDRGWRDTKALIHAGALARWEPSTDISQVFSQVTEVLESDLGETENVSGPAFGSTEDSDSELPNGGGQD